ncbi:MAG TPA: TrkA family potassium uptake protein [Ktedonosporobacter sp.]|nr:TrkA family potassium uptake protein [Ktedonosporobacter sp.]
MYIIVGGGGQIGYYVVKGLLAQGHEVLLLDKDSRRVQTLSDELGSAVLRGDACEARTMDEVGCNRADVVIAVTGDDEDNLVICQMAKERFHVRKTIARVNNPKNERIFTKLGIDISVSPTKTILRLIETEIPHHTIIPLMTLRKADLEFVEVSVPAQSPALGKKLATLELPVECNVVLIVRGQEYIVPTGESTIEAEDQVFALVKGSSEAALRTVILGATSS